MLDFFKICAKLRRDMRIEIYPEFLVKRTEDLMIRGQNFYAIWNEETGLWDTDEFNAIQLIDKELTRYKNEHYPDNDNVCVLYLSHADTGQIDKWNKYCKQQMIDTYCNLDQKLTFQGDPVNKKDYASKRLPYELKDCDISAYQEMVTRLYNPEELHKIEWAIGSVVCGQSKDLQKFIVLYGEGGTGKSTIIKIVQDLFDGYCSVFNSKALGSSTNSFALEPFKSSPLVAIEHDGDLSRIEDNTRLNSIVSHEAMVVNEKYRPTYSNAFNCLMFLGTNKPVRITDARSGLIRRLIDVEPTGDKWPYAKYMQLKRDIKFELGGIALHCLSVFEEDPDYYNDYIPIRMLSASNDIYNFLSDQYYIYKEQQDVTLTQAWAAYKVYCEDANVQYPLPQRIFKEELKAYFNEYYDRTRDSDGNSVRKLYCGFKSEKFEMGPTVSCDAPKEEPPNEYGLSKSSHSLFDDVCKDYLAQYTTQDGHPLKPWSEVTTTLKDIDPTQMHFVQIPEESNHIVIDFDIKDETGEKSLEKNLLAASKWPKTYMELSKSGKGVHLHYIYAGDSLELNPVFDDNIEIKVFKGLTSLRRMLTLCNNEPIATISSGLPRKGKKMISQKAVENEAHLRFLVNANMQKAYHPSTKSSIDFIYKLLTDAYDSGIKYDVSDMHSDVLAFAAGSSHNAQYCVNLVSKMPFHSDEPAEPDQSNCDNLTFFDVEIYPNLFLIVYKEYHEPKCTRLFNPTPEQVQKLFTKNLVGFNCRRYDNHICYGRAIGYTNEQLFLLSKSIIDKEKRDAFFREAFNVSYTDVYDFQSKKQSLKKWEIELGIRHVEMDIPWDQPVDESLWEKIGDYCENDVISTEKVFDACQSDWLARQILADIAGGTVNDTTNSLTTKLIFGKDRKPQSKFNYRNMGKITPDAKVVNSIKVFDKDVPLTDDWTMFDGQNRPIFPGYKFSAGVSSYHGVEKIGEGGHVYGSPGMYMRAGLMDIESQHPNSAINENLFGPYTQRYKDLLNARVNVKHRRLDDAAKLFDGKLVKWLKMGSEEVLDGLAFALKIAINSVYGLTDAGFENPFRDPRNVDNIVAKRGALFMINLRHEVENLGYHVIHVKTDSIKVEEADDFILEFISQYGNLYGYHFEHEATYDRICLVNDAVYIARYDENGDRTKHGQHANEWTATGTQFAVPYVFKTLFSGEEVTFDDLCEVKSVSKGTMYLDFNEHCPEDVHDYKFVGRVGSFVPIRPDAGGGTLLRVMLEENKYYAVTGTKGFRWMESADVKGTPVEKDIDMSYYNGLVDKAVENLSQYGDLDKFIHESTESIMNALPWYGNKFDTVKEVV